MNGSGISSSLCGPLCRLLDYWKIPANEPSGFARILHLSLCYLSLWLIASSNSPRYSGMLGEFSSVQSKRQRNATLRSLTNERNEVI